MTITDDEFSVLMIAAQGEYMLPIGRWKPSIESLASKGLMCMQHINGGPQYLITRAGLEAIKEREEDENRKIGSIINRSGLVTQVRALAEESAQKLAQAAKDSVQITGDSAQVALQEWAKQVIARAKVLIDG